ncbi:MAG: YfhO family protein, partial [Vicinamibacteria bacterium]|nr:YfhO family protein [Vicinamibacteria bacterium]
RAALDPQVRLHWSVSPGSLIDFLLPLSGASQALANHADYEERSRIVPWLYLGASTLPLLVLGVRRAPRGALALLIAILVSLGRHTPLASWLSQLPIIASFRFPAKVLWLVSGFWAVLTAIGFVELRRRTRRGGTPALVLGLVLLGLGLLSWAINPAAATDHPDWRQIARVLPWAPLMLGGMLLATGLGRPGLASLVVIIDLVGLGQTYNSYSSGAMFRMRPSIVDELRRQGASRIYVLQSSRGESRSWRTPGNWSDEEAYYFGESQFLLPPQAMRWSIRGSYDSDFTGLARHDFSVLCSMAVGAEGMVEPVLRLGGVTHAIRFPGARPPEFPVVAKVQTFHDLNPLVLRVPDPLPPAYVVHRIRGESTSALAARALVDPGFDPRSEIVRVGRTRTLGPGDVAASDAQIEFGPGSREVVRARLSHPGTLVVLNAYSEGWRALVDGKPTEVQAANLIFQSVDLEPGEHRVEFEYQTPGLMAGLWLSALAWGWMAYMLTGPRPAKKA